MVSENFSAEIAGRQIWRYAEKIAQHNRIQGSPGYRQAAEEIVSVLQAEGVEAQIHTYPARRGERILAQQSFQEWRCHSGELWLLSEDERQRRLARYQESEVSLVQRSGPTPPVRAEMVVVNDAEDPASYKDLDLNGKIALVRGAPMNIYPLAVEQAGAIGLIFDNLNDYPPLRTRADMPDAIQYTSFWWVGPQRPVFGFAVSPRVGEELRARATRETVMLEASVEAELVDGEFENVEYFIPGRLDKEVLLVAHLCHPYPGALDNASGPAVLMEVMRTLRRMLDRGDLPQPELGIRFLLVPEMTGTYAWFTNPANRERTLAALNLDMVGADQKQGGGPLCVEQPPLSTPTFADRFAYMALDDIARNITNFSGTDRYSTCYYRQTRFSGGSDHYIISDPSLGIPCPMLIQWPDKNYHTSLDHPVNLDPKMLALVARVTALYAWGLAAGSEKQWLEFLLRDLPTRVSHVAKIIEWALTKPALAGRWQQVLDFYTDVEVKALDSLAAYAELREFTNLPAKIHWAKVQLKNQKQALAVWCQERAAVSPVVDESREALPADWADRVYARVYTGPLNFNLELLNLPAAELVAWNQFAKKAQVPSGYDTFIEYRLDGERPLQQVLELVELETGAWHPEFVQKWLGVVEKLGLVKRIR
ncbi:MAG: DUF4910 domain-containing protein [Firmicutes bacterium]|nr:DUF4910 domain-containing protein [Bacillota bacterium]